MSQSQADAATAAQITGSEDVKGLFTKWLKQWADQETLKPSSSMRHVFFNAYRSMRDHQGQVRDHLHAQQIKFIGPTVAGRLGRKLAQFRREQGDKAQEPVAPSVPRVQSGNLISNDATGSSRGIKRTRSDFTYIPRRGTKAWAVLAALKQHQNGLHLPELTVAAGRHHGSESLDSGCQRTSPFRAVLNDLIKRGYVNALGNPSRYQLSGSGVEAAQAIAVSVFSPAKAVNLNNPTEENPFASWSQPATQVLAPNDPSKVNGDYQVLSSLRASAPPQLTVFEPGTYDIIMVIDKREIKGNGRSRDDMIEECVNSGIKCEERSIDLADIIWVARKHAHLLQPCDLSNEIVLDKLIERKTFDDLNASIFDGRYVEQRSRLLGLGYRSTFLVEGSPLQLDSLTDEQQQRLLGATTTTALLENFNVMQTRDLAQTVDYLRSCTVAFERESRAGVSLRALQARHVNNKLYLDGDLLLSFSAFSEFGRKQRQSVREAFCVILMTHKGLSAEKAIEAANHYKTPQNFLASLRRCSTPQDMLHQDFEILYGGDAATSRKRINKPTSRRVAHTWLDEGEYTTDTF